jgi:hypothetical protein
MVCDISRIKRSSSGITVLPGKILLILQLENHA